MKYKIKKIPIQAVLREYKRLVGIAPSVMHSSDKELDVYYDNIIMLEEEIKSRASH